MTRMTTTAEADRTVCAGRFHQPGRQRPGDAKCLSYPKSVRPGRAGLWTPTVMHLFTGEEAGTLGP